jgi:glutamate-ammonia-ligase adenylyltransferase
VSDSDLRRLESDLRLDGLEQRVAAALASSFDPSQAAPRVVEALRRIAATAETQLRAVWQAAPERLLEILALLASAAPFFLPLLHRRPGILLDLAVDDLSQPRTAATFLERLGPARAEAQALGLTPADALRRFKYAELARITVRDLNLDLVPFPQTGETLLEISDLADTVLAAALDVAGDELVATVGAPAWRFPDGSVRTLPFAVLGLGKLGSRELNFSSDVDLIYVYEHPGFDRDGGETVLEFAAGGDMSPTPYFTRLAQGFGRIVSANTGEGFLYRVDLDLRPEGSRGPLVISSDAFVSYYDDWAATWERAACLKARPVAGDTTFGWKLIRDLVPVLHRSAMDLKAVAAIKELKERVEEAKVRGGDAFNVKLGAGGIRDVESVAQALQLLHGGRIPQVRQRSTQQTIEALLDVGVLAPADAEGLLEAYRFYRRTENRLQMMGERQTHTLPTASADLERLARSLGFGGETAAAALQAAIDVRREFCRRQFARVFPSPGPDRVINLLIRHMPAMLGNPVTRAVYESLARQFAVEIDAGVNPERALVNLDRFLEGLKGRRFFVELLLDRPELVRRLAALFATSEYLSSYIAAHPRLIEPIFDDPKTLLLSPTQLHDEFTALHREAVASRRDPTEVFLESLRLFHHRQIVNIGLLDIDGKVGREEVEGALTHLAEVCVAHALDLAARQLEGRATRPPESTFLVVGMGKLGSRELTYGSDLDVIFLYEIADPSEYARAMAQEYFARLAQKLIWALSSRVVTGVCYDVDARLRPSGRQGTLVTSTSGFAAYHARGARVWERQALLRARAVGGDAALAERFDLLRREILLRPLAGDPAAEVHRIRRRMEGELARETAARHDFKIGLGGLLDVESVVQLLQLRHARRHPGLLDMMTITRQLDQLAEFGLLEADEHRVLRNGWEFLQRLSSRLRIVDNRSISDLDEERGDLEALALTLGYQSAQRSGGARRALLADYERHTRAIRAVYAARFTEADG